jgi:hypothetical protein
MNRPRAALVAALVGAVFTGVSQAHAQHGSAHARGHAAGADRHALVQQFDALSDGGRIELQNTGNVAAAGHIREHLLQLAVALGEGDIGAPAPSRLACIPGGSTMAGRHDAITYVFRELPAGAELRIITQGAAALRAIHEFIAFQREHHGGAGAHDEPQHQASSRHGGQHEHDGTQHGRRQHGEAHAHGAHPGCPHTGAYHGGM